MMHSCDKLKSPPLVQCAYCPSVEAAPVGLAVPVGSLYEASKAMPPAMIALLCFFLTLFASPFKSADLRQRTRPLTRTPTSPSGSCPACPLSGDCVAKLSLRPWANRDSVGLR